MDRQDHPWRIAMLSIHSSPMGPLGTQDTGGMSVYVRELSRWMGQQGHCVDMFTYKHGPSRIREIYPNVRLIHLVPDKSHDISKEEMPDHLDHIFQLLDQFRQQNHLTYDVIHSHYWISGIIGVMAQNRWHCPHIAMFHTLGAVKNHTTAQENEPVRRIAHERWLARVADAIVVPTDSERHNLLCHYHPPFKKVHTIGCGVDLDLFRPMDRQAARRRLGIDTDAQVALYVGRFAPVKGIDILLRAMGRLKDRLPKLHLVVVGGDGPDDPSTRTLKQLAAHCQLSERVTFAGRQDQKELPTYYSAADFLAVPSHYESFGLVMLESLGCNTPVLTTPVGAAGAIIRDGVNGLIIDRADESNISDGMIEILTRQPHMHSSPGAVRATVRPFSWQRIAQSVLMTYGWLQDARYPDQADTSVTVRHSSST